MRLTVLSCPHADRCGGCTRIGEPYPEQLAFKRQRVIQSFARYPTLRGVLIEPVEPAQPNAGYRTRAKLVVGPDGALGLYARGGGHHVVDIPSCRVLCPAVERAVHSLRALVREAPPAAGAVLRPSGARPRGALRAIDVREVTGEGAGAVLVTLVLDRDARVPEEALRAAGNIVRAQVRGAVSVAASFHDGRSPQLLGSDVRVLAGVATARDRIDAQGAYQIAAHGSFVQAHRGQAASIHARIVKALSMRGSMRGLTALDLYAGSGAHGLSLAARGARVTLVESYGPAVDQAVEAARAQGLGPDSVRAYAGDAADLARELSSRGERFDAVVINPPRRGTSPGVRVAVASLAPSVIAYVSCDPETLARDLDHFARLGYAAERAAPFDMIPHTDEVETLAILHRARPPAPRVVHEDDQVLVVEKPPFETVTERDRAGNSLVDRVHTLAGSERAVAITDLDADASGLCVFVKDGAQVSAWRAALRAEGARRECLALLRGIARDKGVIARALPGAADARTRYKRLRVVAGHTLVRVIAEPGVAGQIRAHLGSIEHPVLGDERTGHAPSNRHVLERYALERAFLHANRIECMHPGTGATVAWESELPGDLAAVLARMEAPTDEPVRSSAAPVARRPPDRE